jgi:myosin-5
MIPSSERFLANVMQAVQAQVMVSHERFPRFSADV